MPEEIHKMGGNLQSRKLPEKEFERELLKKVGEEASGLLKVKSKKSLVAELADIIDVIDEISKHKKISKAELKNAQKHNRKQKGGFSKRIFLISTTDHGYRTNEKKYKS